MKFNKFFFIPLAIIFFLLCSYDKRDSDPQTDQFVVVLDAGHGGHDPGNLGNGYMEKNIALNIVLNVGRKLASNPDIKVIYTRKDDSFVDLFVRGEIANKANADLFVSVHCDSHTSDANGAGTFVLGLHANKQNFEIAKKENSVIYLEDNYESRYAAYDINSPESVIGLTIMQEEFLDQSILLGKMMQDNFSNNLSRNDRKVKQAGFIVLHQTFMPSVLIETGFLTNKSEGLYLNSKKGQEEMGNAIADAIINYKNNTRINLEDATSSEEIATTKNMEETPAVGAIVASEPEIAPTADIKNEAPKKEIKEPIVVVSSDLPPNETAVTNQNKTEEVLIKEEDKPLPKKEVPEQEVREIPLTIVEEPIAAPIVDKKKDEEVKKEEVVSDTKIVFKVQLLASSRVLPLLSEEFNGLSTLSTERYKNLVRYMYGKTNSYAQAKLYKANADAKGYSTSFIVAYKDGKRIPVPEALKYVSE
ncbi:N-acetylmuramoyl-L-alanine amidase [uncultured Eudoraea sp.]|uniref:N-acetylmuramoyl-L-alanine amidase family protein n=1 Tax=uncultured Eudoraea sp. TaxID=1035614 RepID=UPI00262E360E|nr:N-acetylmuramoyl-L-alanine amidase [uncultured Eudoraea sp.]